MKKYYSILAVALVCFAAACSENELTIVSEEPETPNVTYIQASANEDATKSSIDGSTGAFTWNTGDQIAVFASSKYCVSDPLASNYEGENAVSFSFSGENVVNEDSRTDFAIYPASLVSSNYSKNHHTNDDFYLILPGSYTLDQVAGEKSPTPMIATNQHNGKLSFKQLCSLLRVTVKDIPAQTTHLEFEFSNGMIVRGHFHLLHGVDSLSTPQDAVFNLTQLPDMNKITVVMPTNNVWRDAVDINLPVPCYRPKSNTDLTGGYDSLTVIAYDHTDVLLKVKCKIKSGNEKWKPARKAARKMSAPLPVFTVANSGEGRKVVFAPGNLQWQYRNGPTGAVFTHPVNETSDKVSRNAYDLKSYNGGMFFFASQQYVTAGPNNWPDLRIDLGIDNPTAAETKLSEFYEATSKVLRRIDLFVFASSGYRRNYGSYEIYYLYKPFAVCNGNHWANSGLYGNWNQSIKNTNFDWGYFNAISKNQVGDQLYEPGVWGLLTASEWTYLLNTRTNAMQKRGFAIIHNTRGLILLPDNWTWTPSSPEAQFVPFEAAISDDDPSSLSITWNYYSEAEWLSMEAAGAVFLPAAGSINPNSYSTESDNGHVVNWGVGSTAEYASGYYWTASSVTYDGYNDRYAYCINFGTEKEYGETKTHWRKDKSERHWGRAVRLVRRLN